MTSATSTSNPTSFCGSLGSASTNGAPPSGSPAHRSSRCACARHGRARDREHDERDSENLDAVHGSPILPRAVVHAHRRLLGAPIGEPFDLALELQRDGQLGSQAFGALEIKTRWDGPALKREIKMVDGLTVIETYKLTGPDHDEPSQNLTRQNPNLAEPDPRRTESNPTAEPRRTPPNPAEPRGTPRNPRNPAEPGRTRTLQNLVEPNRRTLQNPAAPGRTP